MVRRGVLSVLVVVAAACSAGASDPTTTSVGPTEPSATSLAGDSTSTSTTLPTTDTTGVEPTEQSITIAVDAIRAVALADVIGRFAAASGTSVVLDVRDLGDLRDAADDPAVDIFMGTHVWRDDLVEAGKVATIDGLDSSEFLTVAVEAFGVDGGMVAVPFSAETLVLYVNHDVHGPEVPIELLGACPPRDAPCFVMPGFGEAGGFHVTPFVMAGSSGSLLDRLSDGDALAPGLEAFLAVVASPGHDLTSIAEARSRFLNGASLLVGGPWDLGPIEDSGVEFSVVPMPPVAGLALRPPVSVQGFYLSADAPNPTLATLFLTDYLAAPNTQTDLWLRDRRAPVHVALTDLGPVATAMRTAAEAGFVLPADDLEVYWEELGAAVGEIYQGADAIEAMSDAAERIRQRLG